MNRTVLLLFLFLVSFGYTEAQVVKNPAFEMTTSPGVKIKEIESTKNYTILRLFFETPPEYVVGGWLAIMRDMYLRDVKTGKKFNLIKVENVPYYPQKHIFTGPGQQLSFTLYFERVDLSTIMIDIIENAENGFNYFRVALIFIAVVPSRADYSDIAVVDEVDKQKM